MTLPEIAASLTIASLTIGVAVPALSSSLRSWRLGFAARDIAQELQRVRVEALARGRGVGLRFDRDPGGDRWTRHEDGNGNGIRMAEILSEIDPPLGATVPMGARHAGIRFGIPSGAPVPRIPPALGTVTSDDDPIALGTGDLFAASPEGSTSTGTLYLTDGRGLRAIVIYGVTGRLRLLAYDPRRREWRE